MAKKVSVLTRTKRLLHQTEQRLKTVTQKAVERDKMQEGRISNLSSDCDQQSKMIAEKNQTIANKDREIFVLQASKERDVTNLISERERIIRIIDQFLSVQITPLGTTTSNSGTNSNAPSELRHT